MNDIGITKLKELINQNGMKNKDLCEILNLTPQNISNIMNERRSISDSEQKLLKLYFYGIMPFDLLAPKDGYGSELKFTKDEWRILDIMAKRSGHDDTIKWITSHIREYLAFCEIQNQPSNVDHLPNVTHMVAEDEAPYLPKKAHIMAAAGSGIEAEVLDWEGDNDTINVRICGLSMLGTFDDDEVITFKSKKVSRNPYMKKGLIYLVELDGKMLVKEYNTRKPSADELGADYIDNGVVKLLKSHNPDKSMFPDIIITQDITWIAWYDEK